MKSQWAPSAVRAADFPRYLKFRCMSSIINTFYESNLYRFKDGKFYDTNHLKNTARDGNVVIIKKNIYHYNKLNYETQEIQATAVSIETRKHSKTFVN